MYTCQECGATELIQAHHEIPGDDSSLVVLCAECHSKRHPDLPRGLFFDKYLQPYWYNKSASSIAKELGVHPRTIVRVAKRLNIAHGELSTKDQARIKNECKIRGYPTPCSDNEHVPYIYKYPMLTCAWCFYSWHPCVENPSFCPKCGYPLASIRNLDLIGVRKKMVHEIFSGQKRS